MSIAAPPSSIHAACNAGSFLEGPAPIQTILLQWRKALRPRPNSLLIIAGPSSPLLSVPASFPHAMRWVIETPQTLGLASKPFSLARFEARVEERLIAETARVPSSAPWGVVIDMDWMLLSPASSANASVWGSTTQRLGNSAAAGVLCFYHRRHMPERVLLAGLHAHTTVVAADGCHVNPYYLPDTLAADPSARPRLESVFGLKRFAKLEPVIRARAQQMIAVFADRKQADLIKDLAYELPAYTIFKLLGVPDSDVADIKLWATSRALLTWGDLSPEDQIPHAHNLVSYWQYCEALVSKCHREPGDDLPSDLVRLQGEGTEISDEEIAGICWSTLFAGHETTTTLILVDVHIPLSFICVRRLLEAYPQADEDVCVLALMLHDIGWHSIDGPDLIEKAFGGANFMQSDARYFHEAEGCRISRELLAELGWDAAVIEQVCEIIDGHDTRAEPHHLNDRIVRDADKLWRFGVTGAATGLGLAFATALAQAGARCTRRHCRQQSAGGSRCPGQEPARPQARRFRGCAMTLALAKAAPSSTCHRPPS